jgi:hypothetical protein
MSVTPRVGGLAPHKRHHNESQDRPFHGVDKSNNDNRSSVQDHAGRTPQNSTVKNQKILLKSWQHQVRRQKLSITPTAFFVRPTRL